jgi:hypothetical protein
MDQYKAILSEQMQILREIDWGHELNLEFIRVHAHLVVQACDAIMARPDHPHEADLAGREQRYGGASIT